jgi:hypothetical protein
MCGKLRRPCGTVEVHIEGVGVRYNKRVAYIAQICLSVLLKKGQQQRQS